MRPSQDPNRSPTRQFIPFMEKKTKTLKAKGSKSAINCWDSMLLSQKRVVLYVCFFQGPKTLPTPGVDGCIGKLRGEAAENTYKLRVSVKTECHYCHHYRKEDKVHDLL